MHQVGELGAIWNRLPSGCLVASDDCITETAGKHVGTKVLFNMLSLEPVFKSYITIMGPLLRGTFLKGNLQLVVFKWSEI